MDPFRRVADANNQTRRSGQPLRKEGTLPSERAQGCACDAGGADPSGLVVAAFALLGFRRRERRVHKRSA